MRLVGVVRALDRNARPGCDGTDHGNHGGLGRERGTGAGAGEHRTAPCHCGTGPRPGGRAAFGKRPHQRQRDDHADALAHRGAPAEDQLANRARRRADRGCDLLVRVPLESAAHERLALLVGQRADGGDDAGELVLGEDDVRGLANAVDILGQLVGEACVTPGVQGPVADDRVEPGLQVHLSGRVAQGLPGAGEALLDDVLGIGRCVGGSEGDQRLAVTPDDLLEGGVAPLAYEAYESLVALSAQNRFRKRL
jgi:hypothetical protein